MLPSSSLAVFLGALATALACDIPGDTPSNTIAEGFAIQVQNASYPIIHNRMMNLWPAGGGDNHLYLSPAGDAASNLTLGDGVINRGIIHAVINGEYTADDNTTKIFMTQRGDPKALFDVAYGCNPDTDALQKELVLRARGTNPPTLGGHICVRLASGNRHEFRYSPPGNTASRPGDKMCMKVTLAVVHPTTG